MVFARKYRRARSGTKGWPNESIVKERNEAICCRRALLKLPLDRASERLQTSRRPFYFRAAQRYTLLATLNQFEFYYYRYCFRLTFPCTDINALVYTHTHTHTGFVFGRSRRFKCWRVIVMFL